jgi:excinuclease ABC subunit A
MMEAMSHHYKIDMNKPFKDLPENHQNMILRGTGGEKVRVHYHNRDGRSAIFDAAFEGVLGNLERRYRETQSEYIRSKISEYMTDRPCPTCQGKRLRPEALAVTVDA